MKIVVGNPVEGSDFFGREPEQRQIWRKLQSSNLLMLAPRRIGKTSLLKRLRDNPENPQTKVLFCSFAGCQDEMACVTTLMKSVNAGLEFHKQLINALKKVKGFKIAGVGIDLDTVDNSRWTDIGESLTEALSKSHQEQRLVICVDELPIFVLRLLKQDDGLDKVRFFLNWFRDLRQTHSHNIKWILAGSIGLDTVTKRLNIGDTINDLVPYPLGAFDHTTAQSLLLTLAPAYDIQLSTEICNYIIEKIGWSIPYYLQVMLDTLLDIKTDTSQPVTTADIDQTFAALLDPAYKAYFDYWRQRLTEELGKPDDEYATHLLNHICRDPNGVSRSTLSQVLTEKVGSIGQSDERLMYLLDVLENDGYIIENNQRYQFRLAWLREYWKKRVAV